MNGDTLADDKRASVDTLTPEPETAQPADVIADLRASIAACERHGWRDLTLPLEEADALLDRLEAQAAAIARYETALRGIAEGHAHPPEKAARRALVGEEAP